MKNFDGLSIKISFSKKSYLGQYKPTSLKSYQYYIYRSIYTGGTPFRNTLTRQKSVAKKGLCCEKGAMP